MSQRTSDQVGASTPPPREPRLFGSALPSHGSTETPFGRGFHGSTNQSPTPHEAAVEATADGVLVPAVVIGLGMLGLATLRQLRKETVDDFGLADALPLLRLLHID